jgi:SAM-dependent methyltransferase
MTDTTPPDQHDLWSHIYRDEPGSHEHGSGFPHAARSRLTRPGRILELGCGTGDDAAAFAQAGHTVIATDFAEHVIAANRDRWAGLPTLDFRVMRTDEPYPFAVAAFDAVYAHLTLHYFTDEVTRRIVAEIRRVLKPGGLLLFACKSPQDPLYGQGEPIEPDMFVYPNGQVRHFFSDAYARTLLAEGFTNVEITAHRGTLYDDASAWITVVARRDEG